MDHTANQGKKLSGIVKDGAAFLFGSTVYSIAVNMFILPNRITTGGITGIATILHDFIGFPVGTAILLMNLPLFYAAAKMMGIRFLGKTILGTVLTSVMVDILEPIIPKFATDPLLAAVYAGTFTGIGIAVIILRGGSTGGVDIAALLINRKYTGASMGRIILVLDGFVTILAVIVYRDLTVALYSVITIFVSSRVMDSVLYGGGRGALVFCVTQKTDEIIKLVSEKMKRGATILRGEGSYSRDEKGVIMIAVRAQESSRLQDIITQADDRAFVIVTNASVILGEGFRYKGKEIGRVGEK